MAVIPERTRPPNGRVVPIPSNPAPAQDAKAWHDLFRLTNVRCVSGFAQFRSNSQANRARADSSLSLTIFPTPLFRARARDGLGPIYPPKYRYRFAMSRADMARCNQTRDESLLSFRKRPCVAFPRDRRRYWYEAQDRQRKIAARRFSPRSKQYLRSLPPRQARASPGNRVRAATRAL